MFSGKSVHSRVAWEGLRRSKKILFLEEFT